MRKKTSSVNTIIIIIGLMLIARVLGLATNAIIGRKLGAGFETDTYWTAIALTTNIFLGVGSAMATNVIPKVVKLKGKESSSSLINQLLSWILVLVSIFTALYYLLAPLIVTMGSDYVGAKRLLTIQNTRILAFALVFICLTYFLQGILQANEKFMMPAMMSIPFNLLFFVYLFVWVESYGVTGLAFITTMGWLLQCLFLVIPIVRYKLIDFKFDFRMKDPQIKGYFLALIPITIVTLTHAMNILVDNNIATAMDDGLGTTILYSNTLFRAVVQTTVYGITAVMFPKFNHKYMAENYRGLAQSVINVLRSIVLLLIPMSVGLIVLGQDIITIIYSSEVFTSEAIIATTTAFIAYTSFMVAFGIVDVLNKAYYTINKVKLPLLITSIIVLCNYLISQLLVGQFGFAGIIAGTSVAYYIGAIISLVIFFKEEKNGGLKRAFGTFLKSLVSATIMGLIVYTLKSMVLTSPEMGIQYLALMAMCVVIGVIAYGLMLLILREDLVYHNVMKLIKR